MIPGGRTRSAAATMIAIAGLAIPAATASAAPKRVVYNNLNTVPVTVNGLPDEDTYSAAPFEFPFGGMVEFTKRPGVLKSLTTDVDSFTCEHGQYNLENCFTAKSNKKFHYELTAKIYEVGVHNEPVGPIATSTQTFKIPYRPTTNVSCPATGEGKGFGSNCDVGGFLSQITFKHFSSVVLPEKAIILITDTVSDSPNDVVNVGEQSAYKEYNESLSEPFVAEPPLNGGVPAVGTDPLPEEAYVRGALASGFTDFQPVFEVYAEQ
jgi:hypothetical protein